MSEANKIQYKFLFKNISWLFLGRIFAKFISLLVLPIVTRYMSPESYGIVDLFLVEAALLGELFSLSFTGFAARIIYKYDRTNHELCRQYIGVILFYILILSTIGLCIALPFAQKINTLIIGPVPMPNPYITSFPIIYAFFMSFFTFTTNGFISLQQNKKLFLCEFAEFLLILPAQLVGLVWFKFTWVEVVTLQLIGKIIVTVFSLWLMRKDIGFSVKRLRIFKKAFWYSIPFVPLNFSSWIQEQTGKIFLGHFGAISSVGVYSVGNKLSTGFQLFSRPVMTSLKPEISKRLDQNNVNVQKDIKDFFGLFFTGSLFLIFIIAVFSPELVAFFADSRYASASHVIPFMVLALMFNELTGVFQLKFIYKNLTVYFPIITFTTAVITVILNYFLIARFKIVGVAMSALIVSFLTFFMTYVLSQRLHRTYYALRENFGFLILGAGLFALQYFVGFCQHWVVKLILIMVYTVILYRDLLKTNGRFAEIKKMVSQKLGFNI
ncbi:MAG: oligosaccharide flippase family protein [Candidatus Omnitrophica bacterium]|nr:oligosaccharide flippase family protein [Candidatus Omnitrophota bacterium]